MSFGNVSWGAMIDGTSGVVVVSQPDSGSCRTDASGNVYSLNGTLNAGTVRILNGNGTEYTTITTTLTSTLILVKRNSSGAVQWYALMDQATILSPTAIEVDSAGNVYVGGYFYNTSVMTFRSTNTTTITLSKTDTDFSNFLAKYNSSGVVQWAIRAISYTTAGPSAVWALKVDSSDNLYVLATSPGTSTSTTSYNILNSNGTTFRSGISTSSPYQSTWLIKYNSAGNVQWATRCCEGQESRGLAIAMDSSSNIYIGGKLYATATYTAWQVSGASDAATSTSIVATAAADGFFIKYTSAGAFVWSGAITGTGGDINNSEYPVSLAVSSTSLYIGMKANSSSMVVKINNSGSGTTISSLGANSGFLLKLNSTTGAFTWSTKILPSDANFSYFGSVAIDASENVYVGGLFSSASATITDTAATTKTLTRVGATSDGFVVKFNSSGVYQYINKITNLNMPDWFKDLPEIIVDANNNVLFNACSTGSAAAVVNVFNKDESTVGASFTRVQTGYSSFVVKIEGNSSAGTISGTTPIGYNTSTTLTVTGAVGTLQWQSSANNSTWSDIAGATSTTYATPAQVNGTYYYRVAATQAGATVNSSSFTLVVDPQAIAGSISGSLGPLAYYGSTTLTLSGNTGATLQWQISFDNSIWSDIAGATTTSHATQLLTVNTFYRVRVNNGASQVFTDPVTVQVNAPTPATADVAPIELSLTLASGVDFQSSYATDTRVDNFGNMYVVGNTASSGFSISGSQGNFFKSNTNSNGFIGKYNASGIPQWGRLLGNVGGNTNSVDVDAALNVYAVGSSTASGFSISGTNGNFTSSGTGTNMYIVKYSTSGTPQWAKLINNVTNDNGGNSAFLQPGYGLAVTQSGHVYIAGATATSGFTLSGVSGGFTQTVTHVDAFIAMYDNNASGTLLWARRIVSGSGNEYAYKVATDTAGNAYVFGNTNSSGVTISGVSGGFTKGNSQISPLIAKYDMTGTLMWAKNLGDASGTIRLYAGAADNSGNVYGVGYTNVCGFTISGVSGGYTTNSTLSGDSLIVKFDTNGTLQWARNTGSTLLGFEANYGVSSDLCGNVYVTGMTNGNDNSLSGASGFARKSSSGTDSYVAQFDTNGNLIWGKFIEGYGNTTTYDVSVNTVANRLVVAGATNSKYTPNKTAVAGLSKLDPLGNPVWTTGTPFTATFTSIDASGCMYMLGLTTTSGLTISGENGGFTKANTANSRLLIKYNASGVLDWGAQPMGVSGIVVPFGFGYNSLLDAQIIVGSAQNQSITLGGISGTATYSGTGSVTTLQAVSASGTLFWSRMIGNTTGSFTGQPSGTNNPLFIDQSGFTYVVGTTSSGTTITGLSGFTTGQISGFAPAFITKHNTLGQTLWARTLILSSGFSPTLQNICVDRNGLVNVVGIHNASGFTISGMSGGFTAPAVTTFGNLGFLAQYNVSGNLLWAKQIGSGFGTSGFTFTGRGAVTDLSNNIYVLGRVIGASGMTVSGAVNNATITTSSGVLSLIKYDSNGNPQWVKNVISDDGVPTISNDSSGNVMVRLNSSMTGTSVSGYSVSGFNKSDTNAETILVEYSPTIGDVIYWRRIYRDAVTGGTYVPVQMDANLNMYSYFTAQLENNNTLSGTFNLSGYGNNNNYNFAFMTAYNLNNVGPTSFSGAVGGAGQTIAYNQARPLTVSGTRGAIQWQSSPNNSTWSDIVGATGQTYLTGGLTTTTYYRAKSTYGSAPFSLTASVQLTIAGQSLPGTISGQLPNAGFNTTKTLALTGASGTIQWQSSTDNLNYTNITNASATTYTTPALTANTWYRALVQNSISDPVYATAVQVVVDAATVAGGINGTNRITTGLSTALTLSGYTANWFQWQSSLNGSTWSDITGASGITYTTLTLTANTIMNSSASTPYYYRVNTRNGNSASGVTSTYTVTVDSISVAGVISVSASGQNAGYNTTKTLTLSGYTGLIQWQTLSGADYASIVGATSASYTTPALTLSSYSYRAVVTNGVSPSATTTPVTVNVDAQSVAGTISGGNLTVQAGEPYTLTLNGNTGNIQWQTASASGGPWTNVSGATTSTFTTSGLYNPLTYYRAAVTNGNSAVANSTSVLFTINALYQIGSAYAGQIGVSGIPWSSNIITKMDTSGNMYLAGSIRNSYTLSGQYNNFVKSTSGVSTTQGMITKLDASGNVLFATQVGTGTSGNVDVYGMAYDSQGNMYVAGSTYSSGYTISGPNGSFVKSRDNDFDGFFAKYNASGQPVWGRLINGSGGISSEYCYDMFVDASDNLYMTTALGVSGYTLCGTVRSFTTNTAAQTPVISRVDTTSGFFIWNQGFNGTPTSQNGCIMKTYDNKLFAKLEMNVSGLTVSGTSGSFTTISGYNSAFMTFDIANGEINMANAVRIPAVVRCCDIDFSGNIVYAGYTNISGMTISGLSGNVTKSTTNIDGIMVKFTPAFTVIWARLIALASSFAFEDIAVDANGNILTTVAQYSQNFSGTFGSASGLTFTTNMFDTDGSGCLWSQTTSGAMRNARFGDSFIRQTSRNEIFVNGFKYALRPIVATTICGFTPNVGTSLSRRLYSYGNVGGMQWQQSTDNVTWSNIVGATQDAYVVQNASASTFYRVTVTGQVSGSLFTGSGQRLVVDPPSVAGSISGATAIQKGTAATLTTAGNTGTLQWQTSADGASWANIGGATSASYTTPRIFSTTYYRVAVTNLQSPTVFTSGLTIAASDLSNPGAITGGNVDVLYGAAGPTLTVVGNTGIVQWQSSADNASWANISGETASTYATGTVTNTMYYRVVATNGGSPAANSVSVGVFVNNNKKNADTLINGLDLTVNVAYNDISYDSSGSMYTIGVFRGSGLTLSGANGGFTTVNGSGQGFVAKYNASGVVDWARLIGSGDFVVPNSVFVDTSGRTHIVGRISGGTTTISGLSGSLSIADRTTFYCQYNSSGTLAWQRQLSNNTTYSQANKVFVNASNLVCIVNISGALLSSLFTMNMCGLSGRVAASINDPIDFLGGGAMDAAGNMWLTGTVTINSTLSGVSGTFTASGGAGMFASYYNASGVAQWNKQMGNAYNAGAGMGVAIDQSGNSYFTGYVNTAITISGLSGNFVKTVSGNNDIVLVKYNRAGDCLWARNVTASGGGNDVVDNLAADAAGNVWIAGYTRSSGLIMSGLSGGFTKVDTSIEGFVANYNANGVLQWAQLIRGYGNVDVRGVALNISAGQFAITGVTNRFGSGALAYTLSGRSSQTENIFFSYDAAGNFVSNAILAISGARMYGMNQSGNIVVLSSLSGNARIFNQAGAIINSFSVTTLISSTQGVGIDNNGFIYYTGTPNTSTTISGLSGGYTSPATASISLTSYDSTGNMMWSRLTGISTKLYQTTHDGSGNSYIFGQVSGSTHLRVEKWLPTGTLGWGTNLGYTGMTAGTDFPSMYVDTSGFVGVTFGTAVSGITISGVNGGITSSGTFAKVFVTKLNQSGVVQFGRQIAASSGAVLNIGSNVASSKIIGDASGNTFVTSYSNISGTTFSGGSLGNFSITSGADQTGFIHKFDSNGNVAWGRIIGFGGGIGGNAYVNGTGINGSGNWVMSMFQNTGFTISGANGTLSGTGSRIISINSDGTVMNAYRIVNSVLNNTLNNNDTFINASGNFTGLWYQNANNQTIPTSLTTSSGWFNGFVTSYSLRALGGIIAGNDVNLAYNTARTLTLLGSYGSALQWQSSADSVTYSDISGETSTSYTTPSLITSMYYRVQVTDTVNGFNATSAATQVVVDPQSVAGPITGAETSAGYNTGKTLTLTVYVGTVQWQSSVDNVTFSNITGATSTTYTTPNLLSSLYFRAVVTSGVNPSVNSAAVLVSVDAPTNPGIITISSVAAGAAVPAPINTNQILVLRGYVATSIQWQQSADGTSYSNIAGATFDTYTTANVTARIFYRALLQNGNSAPATTQPLIINAQVFSSYSSLVLGATIQNTQVTNLRSTALDNTGNLFVIGDTNASGFTLSGAQGGFTISGAQGYDAFVAMYNSSGTVQWARLIASAQTDTGYGVTYDTSGNVYTVAAVGNVGTISGISGGFTKTTTDIDSAFIKYSASGTIIMARLIGAATYTDTPAGLAVDTAGNVYIAGTTNSSGYTLSGAQGGFTTSGSDANAFVVKYDIVGVVQWARLVGSLGAQDFGYGVSVDPTDSSVYMTGVVATSGYTLSGVSGGFTKITTDSDAFLAKYSASGVLQWGRQIAGLGADFGYGVSNDNSGNAFVVGYTASSGITLSGPLGGFTKTNTQQTAFLAKYDGVGAIQWARQIGISGIESAYGVSCDATGYVWVAGITTESGLTISGVSGGLYKSNSALDSFVASYDSVSGILNRAQLVAGAGASGLAVAAIVQNTTVNRIAIVGGTATINTDINYAITNKATALAQIMVGSVNASGVPLWNAFGSSMYAFSMAKDSLNNTFCSVSNTLVKYDNTGSNVWTYTISGLSTVNNTNIAADNYNNVYLTGYSSASGFTISGAGISGFAKATTTVDSFIVKVSNNSGTLQWAQLIPNTNNLQHISADTSGNVVVGVQTSISGFTMSGVSGGYFKAHSSTEYVVLKYSLSGVLMWAKSITASGFTTTTSQMTTDVNNQIFVTGFANVSGLTISGPNGGFTTSGTVLRAYNVALTQDGNIKWGQLVGDTTLGGQSFNTNITDPSGYIYTVYQISSAATVSGVSGGFTKSTTTADLFITKHESVSGVLHWGRLIPQGAKHNGIQVDASGYVYVMGQTTLSGFNGSGVFATKTSSTTDSFVLKYDPLGTLQNYGYYYYNTMTNVAEGKRLIAVDAAGSVTFATSVSGPFNMYNQPNSTYGFAKQYLINPVPVAGTISGPAANIGYNTTTTLTLTGNAGTIQWQSSTNGTTYADIAGVTAATYTTPALIVSTYYRVVVTNGPLTPATSTAVQVVVDPQSDAGTISGNTPNVGYNKTKTLTLAGNTGTIQWQSSSDNVTFSNIVGATTSTYTTPTLTAARYYRVVVTSGNSSPATSASVQVQVDDQSVAGTLAGPASNVGYNKTAALTVTGSVGTLAWFSSTDNSNFAPIAGQTSASYSPTLTVTTYFKVTATNGASDPATSSTVTVTVDAPSVAGTITGNRTVVLGTNNTTMTVSGYTGSIQWQSSTDNVTFANIQGATSASYNAVNLMVTTYYQVVVTNGASDPATSPSVTMTVISYVKPDAPTAVTGVSKNASVQVSWTAPAFDGNKTITGYVIKAYLAADNSPVSPSSFDSSLLTRTVTGLNNGTAYKFTVSAVNLIGTSDESTMSSAVTPSTIAPPPTNVALAINDNTGVATVTWTTNPSNNGGSAITGYQVAIQPGNFSATVSGNTTSTTTFNLTLFGALYSATIASINGNGVGIPSTAGTDTYDNAVIISAVQDSQTSPTAIATYSQSVNKTPKELFLELKTTARNQVNTQSGTPLTQDQSTRTQIANAVADKASVDITSAPVILPLTAAEASILFSASVTSIPLDEVRPTVSVIPPLNEANQTATVDLNALQSTLLANGVDLETGESTSDLHIDIPPNYEMTLVFGAASRTIIYDGETLRDKSTNQLIPLGSLVYVSTGVFRVSAIGSVSFQTMPPYVVDVVGNTTAPIHITSQKGVFIGINNVYGQ